MDLPKRMNFKKNGYFRIKLSRNILGNTIYAKFVIILGKALISEI